MTARVGPAKTAMASVALHVVSSLMTRIPAGGALPAERSRPPDRAWRAG
jgi:hypothetical protein